MWQFVCTTNFGGIFAEWTICLVSIVPNLSIGRRCKALTYSKEQLDQIFAKAKRFQGKTLLAIARTHAVMRFIDRATVRSRPWVGRLTTKTQKTMVVPIVWGIYSHFRAVKTQAKAPSTLTRRSKTILLFCQPSCRMAGFFCFESCNILLVTQTGVTHYLPPLDVCYYHFHKSGSFFLCC